MVENANSKTIRSCRRPDNQPTSQPATQAMARGIDEDCSDMYVAADVARLLEEDEDECTTWFSDNALYCE